MKEYHVRYSMMDTNGRSTIVGSEKIQSALKKNHIKIASLAQGEVYQFSVKVNHLFSGLFILNANSLYAVLENLPIIIRNFSVAAV